MAPASDSPQLRARTSTKLEEQFATRRIHTPAANDEIDNHDLATHPYSTPRRRNVLLFCLGFRAVLALVGQKTFFQPDEFYQSLEPAHRLVWGTGYETWEWRGSPLGDVRRRQGPIEIPLVVDHDEIKSVPLKKESRANLRDYITQSPILAKLLLGSSNDDLPVDSDEAGSRSLNGLLRSWVWPLLFALPYWVLKVTGLDKVGPLLVLAPRLPMIVLAGLTDFYTYRLAGRVLGRGYREAALFLSLSNLFHAHALTRMLTTSAETCLTVMALYYWPLPLVAEQSRWSSEQSRRIRIFPAQSADEKSQKAGHKTGSTSRDDLEEDNLVLSLTLSAMAFVLRPTNIVLWSFLGCELCLRSWRATRSFLPTVKLVTKAIMVGTVVMSTSVCVDFAVTGKWYFPFLTFLTYNLVFGIANFYGSSAWHYHFTQSLPILLSTAAPVFLSDLLDSYKRAFGPVQGARKRNAESMLQSLRMRLLTSGILFTLTVWSFIGHKEWRFLHPLLPILLLYPARYLVDHYRPPDGGLWTSYTTCAYSFLRINRGPFLFLLIAPILPYIYLSGFHGRAQIAVTDWLRQTAGKQLGMSTLFVMPCHSTPWMSHIHLQTRDEEEEWHFLTCEPPLNGNAQLDKTEVDAFYRDNMSDLDILLQRKRACPTHIVLFGDLLATQPENSRTLATYDIVHLDRWNGFDILQDDIRRRGGILVLQSQAIQGDTGAKVTQL